MAYRLLGFAVWRASRWYLRRRAPQAKRTMTMAVLTGAIVAVVLAANRRPSPSH